jgi:RHS repeat-associated protein
VIEEGVIYLVRSDWIGRPVFATTTSGTVVWRASYLPFGGVHVTTGAPIDARFPGQWFQAEAGLYQNWMRDYDPATGRYMQADPLGLVDGASVYGYARGSPGRWVDPTGKYCTYYSLPDGNTGIRCTGNTTFNPSGESSWISPDLNDRELAECMDSCPLIPENVDTSICTALSVGASYCLSPAVGTGLEFACLATTLQMACKSHCKQKLGR